MAKDQRKQSQSKSSTPQSLSRTGNSGKPFLKVQTIKVLRGTIGLLEGIVDKMEAEPVKEIPHQATSPAITITSEPVLDTTTAIPEPSLEGSSSEFTVSETPTTIPEPVVSDTPTVTPEPIASDTAAATPVPAVSDNPTIVPEVVTAEPVVERTPQLAKVRFFDRILPSFDKLQAFWDGTLAKIRTVLPAPWNEKLSDWTITGAIAAIVVVVMVTTAALLPEPPKRVAQAPPKPIETPPQLKAPKPPQPVKIAPPPAPELTPEQSLVASIQSQVAELTDRYGQGLIQSVEANFLSSRLLVKVSDRWYELPEPQQNKLANEILLRSRELDFSKLEITDLKGTLLARNPVVGSNMVILKRQELAANLSK
jgi:hypothetical protein